MRTVKSNNNVVYDCSYHVVWCTKYRRKVITPEVRQRLVEIAHNVANNLGGEIKEISPTVDHVHMLITVDPQFGIHRLVKAIKGRTSRLLRYEFKPLRTRLPTLWSNSYFVATTGGASLEIIKRYVENQPKT